MFIIDVILVGVWIYLVWMVWKKKTNIFHSQMEPKLAERRYKMLKIFLLVAGISFAAVIATFVVQATIFGLSEEKVSVAIIIIGGTFQMLFYVGTIGSLVIFLIGRLKTTQKETQE